MRTLERLIADQGQVVAPVVSDPLAALLAQQAGFRSLYLGGNAVGWVKGMTEANVSLNDMMQVGVDIRAVCRLPLILDGTCGWGDAMHMRRTIGGTVAAGFAAIEIEDEVVPKRAHHIVNQARLIPLEHMVAKIEEAAKARGDADVSIIGRTNAARIENLDEGLRRAEALRKAGADILWVLPASPEDFRTIGERLGGPLMAMGGVGDAGMSREDLKGLGYTLVIEPFVPLLAGYRAMKQSYEALAAGKPDPNLAGDDRGAMIKHINDLVGVPELLEIERRTTEKDAS